MRVTSTSETNVPWARMMCEVPGIRNSMSPLPSSRSAPISSSTTRESLRLVTWNAIRAGRFPLIKPGDHVDHRLLRGQDQVNAHRPR